MPAGHSALRRNTSEETLHVEVPPKLEQDVLAAEAAYAVAKAADAEAAARYAERQPDEEELAKNKGKTDPAAEAELEELRELADECHQKAKLAKQRLQDAERTLARARQHAFVKAKSERNVLQSRVNADNYAAAYEYVSTSIDQSKADQKEATRSKRLEALEKARAEARKKREMHFATHVETFAKGFRGSWAQGKGGVTTAFPTAPRVPRSAWQKPDPPPEKEPESLTALKVKLGQNLFRVVDLFNQWDVDCDHTISKEELRLALGALRISHDEESLQALFLELDADKSGSIDFEELHHALRKHAPKRMPPNNISLTVPKRREQPEEGTGAERRAVAALKKALHVHLGKVASLFQSWDSDGNGQISKKEVKRALAAQCIPVDDVALSTLFKKLDTDNSGEIDFRELNKLLRKEFVFESEVAQPRVISVGNITGIPASGSAYGSSASLARPHTSPAGTRIASVKQGARAATPSASQARSRIAFEQKMRTNPDLAVLFDEREQAMKDSRRGLTVPPSQSRIAGAPAADMTRSKTEPKLVQRG